MIQNKYSSKLVKNYIILKQNHIQYSWEKPKEQHKLELAKCQEY